MDQLKYRSEAHEAYQARIVPIYSLDLECFTNALLHQSKDVGSGDPSCDPLNRCAWWRRDIVIILPKLPRSSLLIQ